MEVLSYLTCVALDESFLPLPGYWSLAQNHWHCLELTSLTAVGFNAAQNKTAEAIKH